jgi:hypothetical protein
MWSFWTYTYTLSEDVGNRTRLIQHNMTEGRRPQINCGKNLKACILLLLLLLLLFLVCVLILLLVISGGRRAERSRCVFEQCDKLWSRWAASTPTGNCWSPAAADISQDDSLFVSGRCQAQSPLYSKPQQHVGEFQTISNSNWRDFLYSKHAGFTDNIQYFVTVHSIITRYVSFRNFLNYGSWPYSGSRLMS